MRDAVHACDSFFFYLQLLEMRLFLNLLTRARQRLPPLTTTPLPAVVSVESRCVPYRRRPLPPLSKVVTVACEITAAAAAVESAQSVRGRRVSDGDGEKPSAGEAAANAVPSTSKRGGGWRWKERGREEGGRLARACIPSVRRSVAALFAPVCPAYASLPTIPPPSCPPSSRPTGQPTHRSVRRPIFYRVSAPIYPSWSAEPTDKRRRDLLGDGRS